MLLAPRLSKVNVHIHQTRRNPVARAINDRVRMAQIHLRSALRDLRVLDNDRTHCIQILRRIQNPAIPKNNLHFITPAARSSAAIRTKIPFVTCSKTVLWGPSATASSISTPRFIGPGCMISASGLAAASFS